MSLVGVRTLQVTVAVAQLAAEQTAAAGTSPCRLDSIAAYTTRQQLSSSYSPSLWRGYTRSPFSLTSWALLLDVAAGLISKRETFLQFALMDGLGPAMEGELSLEGFKLKKQREETLPSHRL